MSNSAIVVQGGAKTHYSQSKLAITLKDKTSDCNAKIAAINRIGNADLLKEVLRQSQDILVVESISKRLNEIDSNQKVGFFNKTIMKEEIVEKYTSCAKLEFEHLLKLYFHDPKHIVRPLYPIIINAQTVGYGMERLASEDGWMSLNLFLANRQDAGLRSKAAREILGVISNLHANGLYHGDLNYTGKNVLARLKGNEVEIKLIDPFAAYDAKRGMREDQKSDLVRFLRGYN